MAKELLIAFTDLNCDLGKPSCYTAPSVGLCNRQLNLIA